MEYSGFYELLEGINQDQEKLEEGQTNSANSHDASFPDKTQVCPYYPIRPKSFNDIKTNQPIHF